MKIQENGNDLTPEILKKYQKLQEILRELGSVAVAFSSGVDSTFLLKAAHDTLGERAIAVTLASNLFPGREAKEARDFCEKEGIRQFVCHVDELKIKGFAQNPPDRCYICKKELFTQLIALAAEQGIQNVAEGSNMDDLGDYRPGLRAVAELGIKSPLRAAELTKHEIRQLSKALELPTWQKPSFACLASRFVYGEQITSEKLKMVEQAEQLLLNLGFTQFRVRIHGRMARIEVLPENISKLTDLKIRTEITEKFQKYGFSYVTLDLKGYRTGSMNETLKESQNGEG